MKIICLLKFVPDIDDFKYDNERNVLIRDNVKMILNPDDGCALGFALKLKKTNPQIEIEIVTMAPKSIMPKIENLLRLNVDRGTIISDKSFVGSDTYVTSRIISRYLESQTYDCILTGTHAIDGDTSHVPAQVGALLGLNQMSHITKIDEECFCNERAVFEVESEEFISTYEMELPGILSILKESKYKLPFVRYNDMTSNVDHKMNIVTNEELAFKANEIGIEGSLTKVSRTYVKALSQREKIVVSNDEIGIEAVYGFLKEKGFV